MIPGRIQRLLERQQASYRLVRHRPTRTLLQAAAASDIDTRQLVRAVLLADEQGLLMAVLPAEHILDFAALEALLGRKLAPVPVEQLHQVFSDCEPRCCPPAAAAYGLDAVLDEQVDTRSEVFFEPGNHSSLIRIDGAEFRRLLGEPRCARFSSPVGALDDDAGSRPDTAVRRFTPAGARPTVESIHELPPIPTSAARLLELAADARAGAAELAEVIQCDAPLTATILRYANSPLYGFAGRITDVKGAIARVLGFDFVLNLALGISIGRTLRVPADGPLGLDAFWRHSVYCAALVERLGTAVAPELRPRRGTAHVAGLLHDIGLVMLGEAFQAEFFLLNRYLRAHPDTPLQAIEQRIIGVGHEQIGAWLLQSWGLPPELVTAARHHHDPEYWGPHAVYPQLVLIANRLLAGAGILCGESAELPQFSLQALGLTEPVLEKLLEEVLGRRDELEELARQAA